MATPCQKCNGRGKIQRLRERPGLLGRLRGPERVLEPCTACNGTGAAHERQVTSNQQPQAVLRSAMRDSPLPASPAAAPSSTVSRCRYVMCPTCNAVHDKETTLSGWRTALGSAAQHVMFGTRTCQCGYVMQVGDIYQG